MSIRGGVTGSADDAMIASTGTPNASVIAEEVMLTKVVASAVPKPETAVIPLKSSLVSITDTTIEKLVPAELDVSV